MSLREVLEAWNPWWSLGEVPMDFLGKPRDITTEIMKWIGKKRVKVLVGPRRAGKTTVMYQIAERVIEKDPRKAVYINFEDPEIQEAGFKRVYEEARKVGGRGAVLLLDEVQNVPKWDMHIRAIYDRRDPVDIVVSGSTLAMVGKQFSRKLAGRTVTFKVYPFTLLEAARIREINPMDPRDEQAFSGLIEEIMKYGAFPEIFLEKTEPAKRKLAVEYYESVVARDISAGHNLDLDKSMEIAGYITRNAGNPISINKISKVFRIAYHTAERYVEAFKDSMVMFEVRRYAHSIKTQLAFPRKFYPIDPALKWAIGGPTPDSGRNLEMLVGIELFKLGAELYYWSNDAECDFILSRSGKPKTAVQVTLGHGPHIDREIRGLELASKELGIKDKALVTRNPSSFLNLILKNAKVFK